MFCNLKLVSIPLCIFPPTFLAFAAMHASTTGWSNTDKQYAMGMCCYHNVIGWRNSLYNGFHATSTSHSVCGVKSCCNLSCSALDGSVGHVLIQKQRKERKNIFISFLSSIETYQHKKSRQHCSLLGLCFTFRQMSPAFKKKKKKTFFLLLLYCSFREPATVHAFSDLSAMLNKQAKHKLMLAAKFRSPRRY